MQRLLTTSEAARLLNVDPATVWRWSERGKLRPVMRIGHANARLFDPNEVRQVAEKRKALAGARA